MGNIHSISLDLRSFAHFASLWFLISFLFFHHIFSPFGFTGTRLEAKLCSSMGKHGYQLCQSGLYHIGFWNFFCTHTITDDCEQKHLSWWKEFFSIKLHLVWFFTDFLRDVDCFWSLIVAKVSWLSLVYDILSSEWQLRGHFLVNNIGYAFNICFIYSMVKSVWWLR